MMCIIKPEVLITVQFYIAWRVLEIVLYAVLEMSLSLVFGIDLIGSVHSLSKIG